MSVELGVVADDLTGACDVAAAAFEAGVPTEVTVGAPQPDDAPSGASWSIVLAFTQFVEPLLRAGAAFVAGLSSFTRVLPGSASDALVGASVFDVFSAAGQADPLVWWQGGLVLAAYAVVFVLLGATLSWRRDVT